MPDNILRTLISPAQEDISNQIPFNAYPQAIELAKEPIFKIVDSQQKPLQRMLKSAQAIADDQLQSVINTGLSQYQHARQEELDRLSALAKINPAVRDQEIQALKNELDLGLAAISASRSRLDAIRVIIIA